MISVIICHHKGRLIDKAIISLLDSAEVEFEIIVASSDAEGRINLLRTKFPQVKFIDVPGGPAHKRNIASRFAKGEYLAFFDDDIEANRYALFRLLEQLKISPTGMVYGKLLNMEHRKRFDEAGSFLTQTGFLWARAESGVTDSGQFETVEKILAGKSASCMIHRKVFWEVGGFDASYEILAEETDLSWRVWLAGYTVLYVPRSITFHAFNTRFKPKDMYTPARVYFNGCRNYLSMLYTNLGKKRWIFPLATQLIVWTLASIGMFITGKREASFHIMKGIIHFFRNIVTIWHKRVRVQRTLRKISDRDLLPIIMRTPPPSYYIKRFFHYIKTGRHG